jgi:hypothetical protein
MKKFLLLLCGLMVFLGTAQGADQGLGGLFQLGQGLADRDADGHADTVLLRIYLPDRPTSHEAAAAADIAARANFESLVVDFSLVRHQREISVKSDLQNAVLINPDRDRLKKILGRAPDFKDMEESEGSVTLHSEGGTAYIVLRAGSGRALLAAARAFFLRWPYLWEIWGREEGITYMTLHEDLRGFLEAKGGPAERIIVSGAHYEFKKIKSPHETIKRLRFDSGQIQSLDITIICPDGDGTRRTAGILRRLEAAHRRGEDSEILSYPGAARLNLTLLSAEGDVTEGLVLKRMGYPKRMLTASYRSVRRAPLSPGPSGLLPLLSLGGIYGDADGDKIPDTIRTSVILPEKGHINGVWDVASRLVLHTAGASFPLVKLASEVEKPDTLLSPILIGGENALVRELVKKGKLPSSRLKPGTGEISLVPAALNKSSALVIRGGDEEGLAAVCSWFSRTFPYLVEYGSGEPDLSRLRQSVEEFLEGRRGSAEAFFVEELEDLFKDWENKEFQSVEAEIILPEKNPAFAAHVEKMLKEAFPIEELSVKEKTLEESRMIFQEEKEFAWEVDDALGHVKEALLKEPAGGGPVAISLGVSESPRIREKIREELRALCRSRGIGVESIQVLSAYKQGFFWLTERVLPRLQELPVSNITVEYTGITNDYDKPKRFYTEPYRWLQELYPVDEILSRGLDIPIEDIAFQWKEEGGPVYKVTAEGEDGRVLFTDQFSPRTREALYLEALPEWGKVTITTGWAEVHRGGRTILLDTDIRTDLERFWDFYQKKILPETKDFIMKNTGGKPAFDKQPYFKRLMVEMWFSEPDFRLELDEEIVSSLEAMHDEFYFDTLDFLRGITRVEIDDEEVKEDTSRYSAPGNILPLIHASTEGKSGRIKAALEDWQARSPQMTLRWKEEGGREDKTTVKFAPLKPKNLHLTSLLYDGGRQRLGEAGFRVEMEKEKDYSLLIDIIETYRNLRSEGKAPEICRLPGLDGMTLRLKQGDLAKEEFLPVGVPLATARPSAPSAPAEIPEVPVEEIISYEKCLELSLSLGRTDWLRAYIAGESYEKRQVPVLEAFTPMSPYVSLARLITFKPTLYLSGRQHANEVSSTNYILKLAERLAGDPSTRKYLDRMNVVMHPMENPDGSALAYKLQEITPFHSLHAGRYTALGIDVGYQVGSSKPLLPEAKVRGLLNDRWKPDIHLNLHGYPSHEWVQQFSGYSPYMFRDYWIPRGWFVYFSSLTLPIYDDWAREGRILKNLLIEEMNANPHIKESNRRFYDRYRRWASRWQPHMDHLELYDGLNIYAKRRSGRESTLTSRRRLTFVEQTPELMDETARGEWLAFLTEQGLTHVMAHLKYLDRLRPKIVRIDEEGAEAVSIRFVRSRPGDSPEGSPLIVKSPAN